MAFSRENGPIIGSSFNETLEKETHCGSLVPKVIHVDVSTGLVTQMPIEFGHWVNGSKMPEWH